MIDRSFTARIPHSLDRPVTLPEHLLPADSVSPAFQEELRSLSGERNVQMYQAGLLTLGDRLQAADCLEAAAALYHYLLEQAPGTPVANRAQSRLDAITGRGSIGPRAEFLLRRLAREATHPAALLGMTAASTAFRMTRLATLSRLISSPAPNFFSRGVVAGVTAGLAGFTVEATVFPLATHAAAWMLGGEGLPAPDRLGGEFASSFIVLGALRLGGLSSGLVGNRTSNFLSRGILGQAGMLGGIFLGQHLETAVGLRPRLDGATTLTDSLATLLIFNVAGRLAQRVTGEGFRRWEQALELQARQLKATRPPDFNAGALGIASLFAGPGRRLLPDGPSPGNPPNHPLMMAMSGGRSTGPGGENPSGSASAASEVRYEALVSAIPDAIFRIHQNGTILDIHAEVFGIPLRIKDQYMGVNFRDLPISRELIQMGLQVIHEALSTQQAQRVEYRLPMPDGSVRDQEARVVVSGPEEVVAIVRDITEPKRSNAERERLLQVIEASADYISMATPDGKIFFTNRAARLLMGLPQEADLSNRTFADYHPAWARDRIVGVGIPHVIKHGVWVGETALLHHDGHEVPVHQMILAHRGADSEIAHFSTIIRDLTALKRAQHYEVAQSRLESVQLIGRGLAHDGNNAVTPMDYYLREMADFVETNHPLLPESEVHRLREAHRVLTHQVDRIKGMFQRFRKLTAEPQVGPPYDFHSMFRNPEIDLQPQLGEQIKLDMVLDPRPFRVRIPREQMADVLQNLLVNARDSIQDREIRRVFIVTRRVSLNAEELNGLVSPFQTQAPKPGEFLRLRIEDTGAGITASTLRKIFLPYFSTKGKDQSHGGIGLALVQKYIQEAGGFVTVHSQVGSGTAFEIYLPLADTGQVTRDSALRERLLQTTVLVAEDEPMLLRMVMDGFRAQGYKKIYGAVDGREAIRLLEDHPEIGLLVTDAELPKMSGTQVIAWIRKRNPRMPMVLWTGGDARPYNALMNRFGRTAEKPLLMEDLIEMAEGLMEKALKPDPEE